MRISIVALMALLAIYLPVQAYAEELYYIELGENSQNVEAAGQQWDALAAKYPKLLSSLKHYPNAVVHHGKRVGVDLFAGPLTSRAKADKVCKKLFSDNVPCFVAEGMTQPPEYKEVTLPIALPWLAQPTVPVAVPTAAVSEPKKENEEESRMPRRGLLSWLHEDEEKPAPAPEKKPARSAQAKVEVAEAIHVPLTAPQNVTTPPVSVKPLPAETQRKPIKKEENDGPGWLNIYNFASSEAAGSFWQQLRESQPERTAGMRVRIVRPVATTQSGAPASLSIGPFAGHADAEIFCHDGVHTLNDMLQCRFELGGPSAASNVGESVAPAGAHGDAYAERRRIMMLQRGGGEEDDTKTGKWTRTMSPPGNTYWVQVLAADSQMEALEAWEEVRTANSDLLEGTRSSVSASLGAHKTYVVRVGPIAKNEDALALCKGLEGRGVKCSVMLASGM